MVQITYSDKNPQSTPELIEYAVKNWRPKSYSDGSDAFMGALYLQGVEHVQKRKVRNRKTLQIGSDSEHSSDSSDGEER